MDFSNWLVYMTAAGGIVTMSWITEQIPAFGVLSPALKRFIHWTGATILALAAWAIVKFVPAETLETIEPVFRIIAGNFAAIFLSQTFHSASVMWETWKNSQAGKG